MELNKSRLYYSIGEVADMLEVKTSVIRFWEKEFAVLKPFKKAKNSKRKYKVKDIETLFKIKTLLYKEQYTIKGANEKIEKWQPELSLEDLSYHLHNGSSWSDVYAGAGEVVIPEIVKSTKSRLQIRKKVLEIRSLLEKIR